MNLFKYPIPMITKTSFSVRHRRINLTLNKRLYNQSTNIIY